jgi:hypothetical protein
MPLITRQGKGEKLTIQEMDGNLEYLEGIAGIPIFEDINVIFVSPNGDDTNSGSAASPLKTLIAAKNLAVSGDVVYVFPGTWTFDNRNSEGNPYNTDQNNKLNLWKNGVNYYFSPGVKIQFINQTVTGSLMALFRPMGGTYETCSVYGKLEFNSYSEGANTSGGRAVFFAANTVGTNFGYEFKADVKSLVSTSAELMVNEATPTIDPSAQPDTITITADLIQKYYLVGQSGSGSILYYGAGNKCKITVTAKEFNGFQNVTNFGLSVGIRVQTGLPGSILNLTIDTAEVRSELLWIRAANLTVNAKVKQAYLGDRLLLLDSTGAGTINIDGNYDFSYNTTPNVMDIGGAGNSRVNFTGNISTNFTSGNGKTIISMPVSTNTCVFNGTINYLGSANTVNALISNSGNAVFSGLISGSFNGSLCSNAASGVTTLQNVIAKLGTADSRISNSGLGKTIISNCNIVLGGSTGVYSAANDAIVANSSIKSNGLGFLNTTSTGSLNLVNSTVITSSTNAAVDFTGAAPVNIANSNSNNTATAVTLSGVITTVAGLNIA